MWRSFSLRLLENGQSLYSRERPGTLSKRAITVPLRLLKNASFSLQLSPTKHVLQQLSTPLPQVVLGGPLEDMDSREFLERMSRLPQKPHLTFTSSIVRKNRLLPLSTLTATPTTTAA